MDPLVLTLIIIGAIILLILLFIWGLYNGLVRLNTRVDEAWSDISVQLKRRADLFGNLVETVKGAANFEKSVLEDVTAARTGIANAKTPGELAKADEKLETAFKGLNVAVEAYPTITATQNYLQLQNEISDTEDKIQASRRFYNGGARDLNIKIKTFPNNIFAKHLGFGPREFFEVADRAELDQGQDASKSNISFE